MSDARRIVAIAVFYSLLGIVALSILYLIRAVLLVLYVSALLAIGFSPAVRWLERHATGRRMPRWGAILILYVLLLGAIAGLLFAVIPPLVAQTGELYKNLPGYVDQLQEQLVRRGLIAHTYTWSELLRSSGASTVALVKVLGAVQSVMGVIAVIVTLLVLPYYLLLEGHALQVAFVRFFPRDRRAQLARLTHSVTLKVSAWLGGQLLLSFIIGSTAALGLWLLGVPYFYVLALLAGVGELIPIVGPILAAVPAILVALTVSPHTALFTAIYFLVQQFVENHLLVPRVMQRQVGVSPVTVIASLLIGSELLGVVGALLAVPTAAIVQVLIQDYLDSDR
ncbi:MAG: AI-2E family transporter [Vicinamibacterales bacterium]